MAPLPSEASGGFLVCRYCGHAHRFIEPPPPPRVHRHDVGSAVLVEWNGRWWDARVLRVVGRDRWEIHYEGWGHDWDEVVGPNRIRDPSSTVPLGVPGTRSGGDFSALFGCYGWLFLAVVLILIGSSWLSEQNVAGSNVAGSNAPTTAEVGTSAAGSPSAVGEAPPTLTVGAAVSVLWGERWFDGRILATYPDGRVRVHYEGYGPEWDEDVTRERLRSRR
jgi:hypothetical protein